MSDQGPTDPGAPPTPPQWGQQPPPPQPGQQWGQQPPPPQPGQQWGQQPPAPQPGQQWGQQPPAPQPGQQWGQQPPSSGGLEPNIASMLAYLLFGWIGGLIMYLTQKHPEVRFHGAQSIMLFGGLSILQFGLSFFNAFVGSFIIAALSGLIGLFSFAMWIFMSIQGYQLKHLKLPVIGDMAEQWASK